MTKDLAVTEVGSGDTLVVFVHGVMGHGRSFDRVAALLDADFRMVWYDRRGYGENAEVEGAPAGVDRHIDDVLDVLDGRRAILAGHSFGGVFAIGAALRAPELVDAVAVYETNIAWAPGWDDTVMQRIFAAHDPAEAGVRMLLGDDRFDGLDDADRARRLRDGRAFVVEEQSVRTGTPPYDVAALRVPLVYGRSSELVMPVVVDYLVSTVAQLEVVDVPNAGHHAHRTDPEGFARLVERGHVLATMNQELA